MSEAWERYHRRFRLTQDVLADVARTGTPTISAARRVQIEAEYGDVGDFLRDLRVRWDRMVDARMDAVLEVGHTGDDHAAAVADLRRRLAAEHRPMWLLLNACEDGSALAANLAHRTCFPRKTRAGAFSPLAPVRYGNAG